LFSVAGQSSYIIDFGVITGNNGKMLGDSTISFPNSLKEFRNGYNAGFKAYFGTYSFFISPGIYYQEYTIKNDYKSPDPFVDSPRIRSAKAKAVIGYQADMFKRKLNLRLGGGLNYNYIIKIDNNPYGVDFQTLSDKYLAYNFDIAFDIFFVNLGLSYEKSIPKILNSQKKFDFIIISAGISF
jgi:hypothetical protein